MFKQFLIDIKNMHWAPRLLLLLVILKTVAIVFREAHS